MRVSVNMTAEQRAEWEAAMLPDRDIDTLDLAVRQVEQKNLPCRVTAMIAVNIDMVEFIREELEARKDSQTRTLDGPWRYTYDPLILTREDLIAGLLDAARWELTRKDGIDVDEILWGDSSKLDPDDDSSPVCNKLGGLL